MSRVPASLLTPDESASLDARARGFEARSGVAVTWVLVARSDDYPELPWRAFALGAIAAVGLFVLLDVSHPAWSHAALLEGLAVLGAGALGALGVTCIPAWGRLLLRGARAEQQVRQQAKALALDRGLAATPRGRALVVLASAFERRVAGVADAGVGRVITPEVWARAFHAARTSLERRDFGAALHTTLEALEEALIDARVHGAGRNEGEGELHAPAP